MSYTMMHGSTKLKRIIVLHAPWSMECNSPCNTYRNCNEPNSKVKLKAGLVHARDTTESESSMAQTTFTDHRDVTGCTKCVIPVVCVKTGKAVQSNTTVSIKVYLMAILDNYMFRPLLAIFRLSSREYKVLLYTLCTHMVQRSVHTGLIV